MVNYGYLCQNLSSEEKKSFAIALSVNLDIPIGWFAGNTPYIDVDELYDGVRIRRITNLTAEEQEDMIDKSDRLAEIFKIKA